jgi:hypothetical protein
MKLAALFIIPLLLLACFASGNGKVCNEKQEGMTSGTLVAEEKDANGLEKIFQLLLSTKEIGKGNYGTVSA